MSAFSTPQNERSFSALIDSVLLEAGRPAALLSCISAANSTIRECQATGLYARDTVENSYVANADPYIWTRPPLLRQLVCARYMTQNYYPKFKAPGKGKLDSTLNSVDATQQFVYASSNYFVFRGVIANETIATWENYWVQPLLYYARLGASQTQYPQGLTYPVRQAYFDIDLNAWQYLNGTNDAYVSTTGNPTTDAARQAKAMHWIVQDWWEMIREGAKAKLFKQFNDPRSGLSYAIYKQLKDQFSESVQIEAGMSMILGGDDI